MPNPRTNLLIAALLILVTLAVFAQVTRFDFVNYDDDEYVPNNPHVMAGLTAAGVKWAFTAVYQATYQPMVWLSFMLDRQVLGPKPMGFHLVNLLLHIANTLLLFFILTRMTKSPWKSALVAALFAVHPLHVESVAWVTERKDVLSTLFWLLTMLAYVRYAARPAVGRYLLVVLFFALGLMSKPMLVTLPFVLLLMDYWPLGRLDPPAKGAERNPWPGWRILAEKIPLLAIAVGAAAVAFHAQGTEGALSSLDRVPFGLRAANGVVASMAYLVKMIWPVRLAVPYPHPMDTLPGWQVCVSALALISFTFLSIRAGGAKRYVTVGWLWYLVTLAPVLGLIQFSGSAMADRFTYVPLIGVFMVAAWGAPEVAGEWMRKRFIPALACAVIAALSMAAWLQTSRWHDSIGLFTYATSVTKDNYIALDLLGSALVSAGRVDEGIQHLDEALRIAPDSASTLNNMGIALSKLGHLVESVDYFQRAVDAMPGMPTFRMNLAASLAGCGRTADATQQYQEILSQDPNQAEARQNLDLLQRKQTSAASSDPANAHFAQGVAFDGQNRLNEAIAEYREAVRVNPHHAQAHCNLGVDLKETGDLDGAIREYLTAIRLKPDLAEAHHNLAVAYFFKERYADAWREIHLTEKFGTTPIPDFVRALAQKMPDPGG